MATSMTYQVDPLNSPQYFRTGMGGDDTSSADTYRDSALIQTLSQLPGAEAFFRASAGGDDTSAAGINPTALAQFLQQNGYSIYDDPTGAGGTLRVMRGDQEIGREEYSNKDTNFGLASSALGAAGGSLIGGLSGLGNVATGALSGGIAGGLTDPTISGIAKGAITGAAAGGIRDFISVPTDAYVDAPSGMDLAADAGSSGANSIGSAAAQFNAVPIPSGSYGPLDDYYQGGGSSDMSVAGPNAGMGGHGFAVGEGAGLEVTGLYPGSATSSNPSQTVEVTGNKMPAATDPTTPLPTPGTAPIDYGDGSAFPPGDGTAYTAPPVESGIGSKIGDFFKANPRLALTLLGAVTGGIKGQGGVGGSGAGSAQSGMTATQAPKFQRQYVAPPAGYRPGFDPEHKYFTGIGTSSTGG